MGKSGENFSFLFVIFALRTLLSSSTSIYVSDRVLKLMTIMKDALISLIGLPLFLMNSTMQLGNSRGN